METTQEVVDTIGRRVKQRREELGWPRSLLADYAGTSPKTIEAIESDTVESPGSILLARIAVALGVKVDDLIPPQRIVELPLPGQRLEHSLPALRRPRITGRRSGKLGGRDSNPQPTDYPYAA